MQYLDKIKPHSSHDPLPESGQLGDPGLADVAELVAARSISKDIKHGSGKLLSIYNESKHN